MMNSCAGYITNALTQYLQAGESLLHGEFFSHTIGSVGGVTKVLIAFKGLRNLTLGIQTG